MAKARICLCVFCKRIFFGISFTWKFISPVVSLLLGQIIPQTRVENKGKSSVLLSENWPHCDRFSKKGRMSNLLYILHATVYKVPPQNVLAAFLSSFGSLIIYR